MVEIQILLYVEQRILSTPHQVCGLSACNHLHRHWKWPGKLNDIEYGVYLDNLPLCTEFSTGYSSQQNPEFPHAIVDNSAIVGSFAFNTFAGVCIALVFATAVFFDLFWPERIEAARLQWTWKLCALLASTSQLAASIATTVVVSTMRAGVSGVPPGEELAFEQTWTSDPLLYRKNTTAVVCIVFCWLGGVSALYR